MSAVLSPLRQARRILAAAMAVLLLLAAHDAAHAALLSGRVDHDLLSTHETLEYVLSLTGGSDGPAPPDLSALNKDFEIVTRGRRSSSTTVGGKPVSVDEWVMLLAPRRAGVLTIPALSVDGLTSAPVKVKVVPGLPAPAPDDERSLYARLDGGDVSPFAQSFVPVVVRIFDSVGMRGGGMGQPTADGASFTAQGGQRVYFKTIGKRRYGVIEQSFLMQPQKSGRITTDAVPVEAVVPGKPNPADAGLANLLGRAAVPEPMQPLHLTSNTLTLDVKPRPEGAQGWFLPARSVSLTQSWSGSPQAAKVGVALTRTLRLSARGASPNQLPPLDIVEVDGLRQYVEASRSDVVNTEGEIGAELVKTIAIVPSREGRMVLPAVTVGWWNTAAGRQESVTLPETTLEVAPAAAGTPAARRAAAPPSEATPPVAAPAPAPDGPGALASVLAQAERYAWPLAAGMALALAALLAVRFALRLMRRRRHAPRAASARPAPQGRAAPSFATVEAAEQALLAACRAGDAGAAHRAAHAWLRLSVGASTRPDAREPLTRDLADALDELSQALYGGAGNDWDGARLRAAFAKEKSARRRRPASSRSKLAPLYPRG